MKRHSPIDVRLFRRDCDGVGVVVCVSDSRREPRPQQKTQICQS